jgi:hypothetical protein
MIYEQASYLLEGIIYEFRRKGDNLEEVEALLTVQSLLDEKIQFQKDGYSGKEEFNKMIGIRMQCLEASVRVHISSSIPSSMDAILNTAKSFEKYVMQRLEIKEG